MLNKWYVGTLMKEGEGEDEGAKMRQGHPQAELSTGPCFRKLPIATILLTIVRILTHLA